MDEIRISCFGLSCCGSVEMEPNKPNQPYEPYEPNKPNEPNELNEPGNSYRLGHAFAR